MNDLNLGFQLMLYGLTGVFSVLILFYFTIVILNKLFPGKPSK